MDAMTADPMPAKRRLGSATEYGLMALTFSAAVCFLWLAVRPSAEDRYRQALAELQIIGRGEEQAMRAFQQIAVATQSGSIDEAQVADRIEREVLPVWNRSAERVEKARSGPLADSFPAEVSEFFRLRRTAWENLVVATRNDDPLAMIRYRELWERADEVGASLKGRLPVRP